MFTAIVLHSCDYQLVPKEWFLKPEQVRAGEQQTKLCHFCMFFPLHLFLFLFHRNTACVGLIESGQLFIDTYVCTKYSLTSEGHFQNSYIKTPGSCSNSPSREICSVLHLLFRQKEPFTYLSLKMRCAVFSRVSTENLMQFVSKWGFNASFKYLRIPTNILMWWTQRRQIG